MIIRNEKTDDYRVVEEMIKKTFWNLSVPGCNEHYFAHLVRNSEDFIPELDFVLEEDGKIIGHIIYVKAKLVAMDGTEKEILSFGPFTIQPDYQRKGYGRKLLEHSLEAARKLGFDTIAIWGNPENYASDDYTSAFGNNFDGYGMIRESQEYALTFGEELTDETLQQLVRDYQQLEAAGMEKELEKTDWRIINSWLGRLYPELRETGTYQTMISYVNTDKLTGFYERRQQAVEDFF